MNTEVLVIGAGLAGLCAAIRLKELDHSVVLIDASLPNAEGALGGFAKFSGAKFSLPPAGMGLLNVIGNTDNLWSTIDRIADVLEIDLNTENYSHDNDLDGCLRRYNSTVLTPNEIDELIERLTRKVGNSEIPLIQGKCLSLNESPSGEIIAKVSQEKNLMNINCSSVFYAGGRLGTNTLSEFGVTSTDTKGIDLGFRVEFKSAKGLENLRAHGPDAKIINGQCRTFCLNTPGEIYRYPFKDISIPGGIVSGGEKSNVGVLYRSQNKEKVLDHFLSSTKKYSSEVLEKPYDVTSGILGEAELLISELYGCSVANSLKEFCEFLQNESLVNWDIPHIIHIPLIDWHWPTFSKENSFRTNKDSIFCLGDASGHARGLLQAAISGWIAAEEYSCVIQ